MENIDVIKLLGIGGHDYDGLFLSLVIFYERIYLMIFSYGLYSLKDPLLARSERQLFVDWARCIVGNYGIWIFCYEKVTCTERLYLFKLLTTIPRNFDYY